MNIAYSLSDFVTAKICGCREMNEQKVTYAFSEELDGLCRDKKDIFQSEIEACERLLRYATSEFERKIVEREVLELKMALDLMT